MSAPSQETAHGGPGLVRELGLLGLVATGVCAMLGAGVNVVPFMIQRNVPGIGPYVMLAYGLGVVPALLAAFAYAILASAMPRAGGSYVFASRALSPYLGFVASFSQWFGLSMAIGVVSYVLVPFLRDIAGALELPRAAAFLEVSAVRLLLPLGFLWLFTVVNLLGTKFYERTLVPLMVLMFVGGVVAIPAGFAYDHADFIAAVAAREGVVVAPAGEGVFDLRIVLTASVLLFSSFIGFDAVAQAGGEAKNPGRNLPLAIVISILAVGTYYMLYTAAVYHAVPWSFIAERAMTTDLTAPGLLGYLVPQGLALLIVGAATIALANDLPAMILSVSRLLFAWSEDGLFPKPFAAIHAKYHTPHWAIVASAATASAGIVLNHSAGDFFVGVDLLVTSMLVNFLLMALSVLLLPRRNPELAREIRFLRARPLQLLVGGVGGALLVLLTVLQIRKDVTTEMQAWYYHAFYTYLLVLGAASLIFARRWRMLRRAGVDLEARFRSLPEN
jgi:amino acid transporter